MDEFDPKNTMENFDKEFSMNQKKQTGQDRNHIPSWLWILLGLTVIAAVLIIRQPSAVPTGSSTVLPPNAPIVVPAGNQIVVENASVVSGNDRQAQSSELEARIRSRQNANGESDTVFLTDGGQAYNMTFERIPTDDAGNTTSADSPVYWVDDTPFALKLEPTEIEETAAGNEETVAESNEAPVVMINDQAYSISLKPVDEKELAALSEDEQKNVLHIDDKAYLMSMEPVAESAAAPAKAAEQPLEETAVVIEEPKADEPVPEKEPTSVPAAAASTAAPTETSAEAEDSAVPAEESEPPVFARVNDKTYAVTVKPVTDEMREDDPFGTEDAEKEEAAVLPSEESEEEEETAAVVPTEIPVKETAEVPGGSTAADQRTAISTPVKIADDDEIPTDNSDSKKPLDTAVPTAAASAETAVPEKEDKPAPTAAAAAEPTAPVKEDKPVPTAETVTEPTKAAAADADVKAETPAETPWAAAQTRTEENSSAPVKDERSVLFDMDGTTYELRFVETDEKDIPEDAQPSEDETIIWVDETPMSLSLVSEADAVQPGGSAPEKDADEPADETFEVVLSSLPDEQADRLREDRFGKSITPEDIQERTEEENEDPEMIVKPGTETEPQPTAEAEQEGNWLVRTFQNIFGSGETPVPTPTAVPFTATPAIPMPTKTPIVLSVPVDSTQKGDLDDLALYDDDEDVTPTSTATPTATATSTATVTPTAALTEAVSEGLTDDPTAAPQTAVTATPAELPHTGAADSWDIPSLLTLFAGLLLVIIGVRRMRGAR